MNVVIENIALELPDRYRQIETRIGDPAGAYSFIRQTSGFAGIVSLYIVTTNEVVPFGETERVVEGLHGTLAENQGVIEVGTGTTGLKRKYLYSLVKTGIQGEALRIQYTLTFQLGMFAGGRVVQIEAFFDELGATGMRETSVYEIAKRNGKVGPNGEGWACDPYDAEYRRGMLMNMAEKEMYDAVFPDHPLTEARRLAKDLIADN